VGSLYSIAKQAGEPIGAKDYAQPAIVKQKAKVMHEIEFGKVP
jgi:hypothetical protein